MYLSAKFLGSIPVQEEKLSSGQTPSRTWLTTRHYKIVACLEDNKPGPPYSQSYTLLLRQSLSCVSWILAWPWAWFSPMSTCLACFKPWGLSAAPKIKVRYCVNPNVGFAYQLLECESIYPEKLLLQIQTISSDTVVVILVIQIMSLLHMERSLCDHSATIDGLKRIHEDDDFWKACKWWHHRMCDSKGILHRVWVSHWKGKDTETVLIIVTQNG